MNSAVGNWEFDYEFCRRESGRGMEPQSRVWSAVGNLTTFSAVGNSWISVEED